jgi:superfamily II DNA helicase RecQ
MKIRTFHIRLTKEHLQSDQDALNAFMGEVTVSDVRTGLITGQTNFWSVIVMYEEKEEAWPEAPNTSDDAPLTFEEERMYDRLKTWRTAKAEEIGMAAHLICSNSDLINVARKRPADKAALLIVRGFGSQKVARYGDDILMVVNGSDRA